MYLAALRSILGRVRLAEREMMLLPEVFHATAELHLAAGDLASLIAEASAHGHAETTLCQTKPMNESEYSLGTRERTAGRQAFH
jgi:hypothetical protein